MNAPRTRPSLLQRLLDHGDSEAWQTFDAIYRPVLQRLLTSWGLQAADREEVIQETFHAVSKSLSRLQSQPRLGSFHGWLARVTRNKMVDHLKANQRLPQSVGGTDFNAWLAECPSAESPSQLSRWDIESRRSIFNWAAFDLRSRIQHQAWVAFQRTAIEGVSAATVAKELGTSVGWVYVAKSRVLARLKATVDSLSEDADLTLEGGNDAL